MKKFPKIRWTGISAVGLMMLTSCQESGPIEVTEVRQFDPEVSVEMPVVAASDTERFRYGPREEADPRANQGSPSGTPRLVWDTPEGWVEAPTTQMRDVNLKIGENGECYLTRLSGGGGGLVANVNRWRGQMGLEDISAEEVAKLPTRKLFKQDAVLVDLEGDFGGMGGGNAKKNYRLLGLIHATPSAAITLKMTGPRELVDANAEKFDAFSQSLDVDFGKQEAEEESKPNANQPE